MDVLLFEYGIGEGESQRYATVVELFYYLLYEGLITFAGGESSSVPCGRRKSSVYRSDLNSLTEVLRTGLHHISKKQIEFKMLGKVWKMETNSHNYASSDQLKDIAPEFSMLLRRVNRASSRHSGLAI